MHVKWCITMYIAQNTSQIICFRAIFAGPIEISTKTKMEDLVYCLCWVGQKCEDIRAAMTLSYVL